MNIRKIIAIAAFLCMLFIVGCGASDNAAEKESNNQENSSQEEAETIAEEQFHSEYTRTELDKKVRILDQYQTRGFEPDTKYGCISIKLSPLFDDEDITRIEYHIEDGNGYFMDTADFNTMKVEEMNRRADTLTTPEENGYHCTLEEQEDIYFTIYYKHDVNLAEDQQHILKGNRIRKLSMVVHLTYQDGSVKEHRYAFDYKYTEYTYIDNFTNGKIYELTKE